jgi:hypothetical protein
VIGFFSYKNDPDLLTPFFFINSKPMLREELQRHKIPEGATLSQSQRKEVDRLRNKGFPPHILSSVRMRLLKGSSVGDALAAALAAAEKKKRKPNRRKKASQSPKKRSNRQRRSPPR